MGTAILIMVLVFGGFAGLVIWWMYAVETTKSDRDTRSGPSGDSEWSGDRRRDVREAGTDYWLEWRESSDGESRGYVVVRAEDDQRLAWKTLPKSEGIRAHGVAGESYHMEDVQSEAFDPGTEIALVPEPENPHGTTSVAIKSADETKHVGYIPTDHSAPVFAKLMNKQNLRGFSMWEVVRGGERVSLRVLIVEPGASIALPEG